MGVEGLYKFINKNCSEIYRNISIYDIKDKSCIIDGMQHIYTQLIYMRSKSKEVITIDGKNISHIHGLINSLTYYLKNGIIPIFIFDGKSPDIKRKKIEERRHTLRQNLKKLKELEIKKNDINDNIKNLQLTNDTAFLDSIDNIDSIIVGTPPEFYNLNDEMQKMQDVQEEYKKIYKKSIILKDYFVTDWIQILELLGLPVLKAKGEADPLCAYILKNNNNVYGIISDDSDMLVFGAPRLMRKSVNQQFTIIELSELINSINNLLLSDTEYSLLNNTSEKFNKNNLIDFSLLLGTDYAVFDLNKDFEDSYELLKYYMIHGIESLIKQEDMDKFNNIKNYYTNLEFDETINFTLEKPVWNKPKLLELKKRLLELNVDEDYIDKNYELFDIYYNKYLKKIQMNMDFNFRNKKNVNNEKHIFDTNFTSNYSFKRPPTYPKKYGNSYYDMYNKDGSNPIPINYKQNVNKNMFKKCNDDKTNENSSSTDKSNTKNYSDTDTSNNSENSDTNSDDSETNYKVKPKINNKEPDDIF
jgi:flap endonuclease-1